MYLVSQEFIDDAKKLGRVLDIRLSFDDEVISGEKVSKLEKDFEATMFATASQQITGEVVGRYDLTDSVIRVEIGIAYNESPFSYVDYGFFIVKEHERVVGAKGSQDKTTFVAYDIMLNAHELYDVDKLGVTYPISVFNLYKAIATYIGTEVSETSVVNGNMMIEEDKYTNIENVTYRNVLDDLSATMGASIIVSKNKLLAKYANVGVNLIKNDFSDFTANQGATVTKNKTFPIEVFKGGRNILPISNVVPHNRFLNVMGYFNGRENTIKSSANFTEKTDSWGLEDGQVYTFVCDICTLDDMTWLSRIFYVNSITNGRHNVTKTNAMEWTRLEVTFTYKTGGPTNILHIYPNPSGSTYYLSNQKIIKGVNLEEPYSPAPEDGYGYTGSDGAYHIQGQGKFSNILDLPNAQSSVDVHNWGDATLNGETLVLNETTHYTGSESQLDFNGDLDFIASSPFIGINNSVTELHENNMRSLSIKDKMKPINILNLTREDAHDNYPYPLNWETIPVNDRSEIVVPDNQIIDKRRDEYAPSLFNAIEGLSYTPFDSETYGVLYLEPLDTIEVVDMNEVSHVSLVTSNRLKFTSGIKETLTSELPSKLKDKYALVTDNERQSMRVYFLVDKQNGIIQGLVEELGDVKDQTAELTIKVDEIELKVNNTSNGNVIGNFNPQDYTGWEGGSRLLYVAEYSKLRYLSGLTYAMGFQPVRMAGSLSEWGLSFFNNGSATSSFGYVVPTENYSYRAKVQRFKPFSIDLLEYRDMITPFHKSTRFTFNNPQSYVQFTSALDPQTVFVRIKFNVTGVTPNDRLEITENMYNRGVPKEYFVSGTEALVYAQSNINILDNKIGLVVDEVKVVDNKTEINKGSIEVMGGQIDLNAQSINSVSDDIHNAGVEINAINGVTTYGKKFEVMSEDRSTSYMKVTDNGVESHKMTAIDMIATNATIESGKVAGFDINGNNLVGQDISLEPNKIKVGDSSISSYMVGGQVVTWFDGNWFNFGTNQFNQFRLMINNEIFVMELEPNGARAMEIDIIRHKSNQISGGSIGTDQKRYGRIYLLDQPDVASDTRYKNDIQDIDPFLLEMIAKYVIPKRYETQFDDKLHFGYIAQDVEMALYQYFYQISVLNGMNKLEASRFANTEIAQFAVLSKSESYMSLLYGELAVLMDAYNRSRIEELEERLTKLELML